MHRAHRVAAWGACGLIGLVLAATAAAQENLPPPAKADAPAKAGNALIVPINGSKRLSMTNKTPLRSAASDKDTIARIQYIQDDPSAVLVVGLQAGSTVIRLTGTDDKVEVVEVVVQLDIDVVKAVLKRAFPTASVEPIPTGTNTIVLVGNVQHAEEIEAILGVARSVLASGSISTAGGAGGGGGTGSGQIDVVNALTVGGVRQVQLDACVMEVDRGKMRNLGVNFAFAGTDAYFGSFIGNLVTPNFPPFAGIYPPPGPIPSPSTNIAFGLLPTRFDFFLQAMRLEALAKLLASPRLVTLSGRPATFLCGGQQAVPEITGSGLAQTVGTRFEPFGTQLTFLPIVLGNGKIYLEVEPSVSTLNQANGFIINGTVVPGRNEQRVRTSVIMEPGQTFAIGGMIQHETNASSQKTPIIGELPFIGPFFSVITHNDVEKECLFLITPYLVDPMDCAQAPCKIPGSESRIPDDFELYLELILEAPRGQRVVCPDGKYKPAYMNDPTYGKFPCGGAHEIGCHNGSCGTAGCANGSCGVGPAAGCSTCGNASAVVPVNLMAPPVKDAEPSILRAGGTPVSAKPTTPAARASGKP